MTSQCVVNCMRNMNSVNPRKASAMLGPFARIAGHSSWILLILVNLDSFHQLDWDHPLPLIKCQSRKDNSIYCTSKISNASTIMAIIPHRYLIMKLFNFKLLASSETMIKTVFRIHHEAAIKLHHLRIFPQKSTLPWRSMDFCAFCPQSPTYIRAHSADWLLYWIGVDCASVWN